MRSPAATALFVGLLALAGCVSPPSDGPVVPGGPAPAAAPDEPFVRPIANPPRPGMTQTEVVAGFLNAAAAVGDNYRTARAYFTPEAAQIWDPGAGVVVMQEGEPALHAQGDIVTAEYGQVGTVRSDGVFVQQTASASTSAFTVVSLEGEWRIALAPSGLLLSEAGLATSFQRRSAYFTDPTGTYAVPDVRLVPLTGPQAMATALVTALLAGPSEWLRPGVSNEIPDGLSLAIGAVPVSEGVAVVELSGPRGRGLSESDAETLGAQFAWTLAQVPGVVGMQITVNGEPVPLPHRRGSVALDRFDRFNPDVIAGAARLYGVTPQGAPALLEGDQVRALPTPSGVTIAAIAAAPTGALYAAASIGRDALLVGDFASPEPPQALPAAMATGPRMDARERVWWTDPKGRVVAAVKDGAALWAAETVDASTASRVEAVAVSRDGTRAALLLREADAVAVHVGVVVQDDQGIRITGIRPLGHRAGGSDVVWHDADEITVLNADTGSIARFDMFGGATAGFAAPTESSTVADAPNGALVVGLPGGSSGLITRTGFRDVAGLGSPAYPG